MFFAKTIVLAVLGLSASALALPTDASTSAADVPQLSAARCWEYSDHRDRRECRDFNDRCRHRDRRERGWENWELPAFCEGHEWF